MRVACVFLPHFCIQVETLTNPDLEDRPVIMGGAPDNGQRVIDCSEEAEAQGVHPGMALREASYLCPDAVVLDLKDRYRRVWDDMLFALGAFSLHIEADETGIAYLDITKAPAIYTSERAVAEAIIREMAESSGLRAHVGIGNARFTARQAAACAWGTLIIEPGGEKDFLSLLPASCLPLAEKDREHLALLGLSTLGKVGGLSKKALISQFGPDGKMLWDMANGIDDKKPIPKRANPICLEREFTSEAALETLGEIMSVIVPMVGALSGELGLIGMSCRKMAFSLCLENRTVIERTFVMKKPTARPGPMLMRLSECLGTLALDSPVISIALSIPDPAAPQRSQENLFWRRSAFVERLDGIRAYFNARYGETPLMRIEAAEEHSRLPERRFRFVEA
jgi:nucleotidyltransferase/DNA polymerase involved in DNA repair